MVHFVEVLRDEALFYVELIRNLDAGLAVPQDHQPPSVFQIPESYFSFVPPPAAQNISKGNFPSLPQTYPIPQTYPTILRFRRVRVRT